MESIYALQQRLEKLMKSNEEAREEMRSISVGLAELEAEYSAGKKRGQQKVIDGNAAALAPHSVSYADDEQKYAYYYILTSVMCFEIFRPEAGLSFVYSSARANGFYWDIPGLYEITRAADRAMLKKYADSVKCTGLEKILIAEMLIAAGKYIFSGRKEAFAYISDIAVFCGADVNTVTLILRIVKDSIDSDIQDYASAISAVFDTAAGGAPDNIGHYQEPKTICPVFAELTRPLRGNSRAELYPRVNGVYVENGQRLTTSSQYSRAKAEADRDGFFYCTKRSVVADGQIIGFISDAELSDSELECAQKYVEYRDDVDIVPVYPGKDLQGIFDMWSGKVAAAVRPDQYIEKNKYDIAVYHGDFGVVRRIQAPMNGYFYLTNETVNGGDEIIGFMSSVPLSQEDIDRIKMYY